MTLSRITASALILAAASFVTVSSLRDTAFAASDKPLVFIFQKQKNPNELKSAAEKVGKFLGSELGREVRVQVPSDYSASIQALVSKQADIAYVSSLPFLLARRDGGAELLLVEERSDPTGKLRTEYDSVLVVREDSPIKSLEDIKADPKSVRMVFTSPTSTSGYVFAYSRFVDEGILEPKQDPKTVFKSATFGGSYTGAIEEVLAGRADVAAVSYYVVEGPDTATYIKPEQLKQVRVIAHTPGVPTHLISSRQGLSPELKERITEALLKLSKEQPELLEDVYGTARFVRKDENAHVEKTIRAVEHIGLPIENLAS